MLHIAPSLDLSSIVLFWKKSRKMDHLSWIDMKLNIPANRPPHGPPNQNLTTLALPECALTNASMSSICSLRSSASVTALAPPTLPSSLSSQPRSSCSSRLSSFTQAPLSSYSRAHWPFRPTRLSASSATSPRPRLNIYL